MSMCGNSFRSEKPAEDKIGGDRARVTVTPPQNRATSQKNHRPEFSRHHEKPPATVFAVTSPKKTDNHFRVMPPKQPSADSPSGFFQKVFPENQPHQVFTAETWASETTAGGVTATSGNARGNFRMLAPVHALFLRNGRPPASGSPLDRLRTRPVQLRLDCAIEGYPAGFPVQPPSRRYR